jgi:hypothetical protein
VELASDLNVPIDRIVTINAYQAALGLWGDHLAKYKARSGGSCRSADYDTPTPH